MNRRSLITSAGALALAGRARAAGSRGVTLASDIDAVVARLMGQYQTPGLAVAVYTPGGTCARGYGVTDLGTGEKVTDETLFYVASSTKSLTGLALASLHHEGRLDLDATLSAYAPDAGFPAAARPGEARLRDLLSHTGGIENNALGYRLAYSGEHDPQILWRLMASSRPNVKSPLGRFEYTNVGYNIATVLTDRKLGVPWQDLLRQEVFAPAGMTHATARMSEAKARGWSIARPHFLTAAGRIERVYLEKTDQTMQSAGGVAMSARDAARWLEFMVEGGKVGGRQVIAQEAVAETCAPAAEVGDKFGEYPRDHYGLGWYLGSYRGERMLHDMGSFSGFRTHVSFMPERRTGVAVFANDSSAAFWLVDAIADYIYDRAAGRPDAEPHLQAALAGVTQWRQRLEAALNARAGRPWKLSRPRAAYAGIYENAEYGRMEVTAAGDVLTFRSGIMHSVAEPYTAPESVRVEFSPGSGNVIVFEPQGDIPPALVFQAARFARA